MKVRHICAILGIAIASATQVFMQSLVASNDHQSIAIAKQLLNDVKVERGAKVAMMALDYRPDNRVMQGPPMRAIIATKDNIPKNEIIVTKALFSQRKLNAPDVGTTLTLVGRKGAYKVKIAEIDSWSRPLGRGAIYPNAFVSPETSLLINEEWKNFKLPSIDELSSTFKSDANRNFDRAKILLLWGAILTALCLLINTLSLSVEANRHQIAILRTLGLTKFGIVKKLLKESFILALFGVLVGIALAIISLVIYVNFSKELFPLGFAIATKSLVVVAILTPIIACIATLFIVRPALSVKPLEAASAHTPKRRTRGMLISFALGFGAFVAVEVWGASLMKAFVPSSEWPDAIVSILPGGVSSFDIEKLSAINGVEKIAELEPLQVNLLPLEELKGERNQSPRGNMRSYRNALLLASDWLPEFRFVEGSFIDAKAAILKGDNCIITEMMARARNWKLGDSVKLDCGRGLTISLKIVGIVDLNWHMVTSRGLLRGLNRMPVNTDGPIFVSFDTIASCDPRLQHIVPMTHLWLNYKKEALLSSNVFELGREVENDIVKALNGANLIIENKEVRGNTVRLHSRDEIADGTLSHGAELIGAMAKIPFIFVVVISLGFITLLVSSAESRKNEFITLRTIGATQFQLVRILLNDAIKIAIKGLVLALLFGSLTGWLFTFSTRQAMANWGLPLYFVIPWLLILKGALGAIFITLLISIPTSIKLIRKPRG